MRRARVPNSIHTLSIARRSTALLAKSTLPHPLFRLQSQHAVDAAQSVLIQFLPMFRYSEKLQQQR